MLLCKHYVNVLSKKGANLCRHVYIKKACALKVSIMYVYSNEIDHVIMELDTLQHSAYAHAHVHYRDFTPRMRVEAIPLARLRWRIVWQSRFKSSCEGSC